MNPVTDYVVLIQVQYYLAFVLNFCKTFHKTSMATTFQKQPSAKLILTFIKNSPVF
jgi:hypothetical protein